ncbi:hypothetical protein EVAR_9168_1 [Eumeta japonica]|uniref:Uncharacterized protein n=1 Tax=Eumeta variegata TaxID=151549 RepID=A0A4C1TW96_EUMVA|nr:hypothetical protein EVAR_9168_1 [Eumeta japonica]
MRSLHNMCVVSLKDRYKNSDVKKRCGFLEDIVTRLEEVRIVGVSFEVIPRTFYFRQAALSRRKESAAPLTGERDSAVLQRAFGYPLALVLRLRVLQHVSSCRSVMVVFNDCNPHGTSAEAKGSRSSIGNENIFGGYSLTMGSRPSSPLKARPQSESRVRQMGIENKTRIRTENEIAIATMTIIYTENQTKPKIPSKRYNHRPALTKHRRPLDETRETITWAEYINSRVPDWVQLHSNHKSQKKTVQAMLKMQPQWSSRICASYPSPAANSSVCARLKVLCPWRHRCINAYSSLYAFLLTYKTTKLRRWRETLRLRRFRDCT